MFDPHVPAARYLDALGTLHRVSGVMGELLDSSASYRYTPAQYATRVQDYLSTLGDRVDFRRDMVPRSTSLWSVLDAAIAGR